jgi:3-deoxy-D-manno-octulosonate 8-phosphate phosphatase (KDO 8-P phosphatase)
MNSFESIVKMFEELGGTFCTPVEDLVKRILRIRAFVFDWDGVFHPGRKGEGHYGLFSEADAMGLNMLRYGCWRRYRQVPFMAIITGQNDKTASLFAERERFDAVYTGVLNKKDAFDHACESAGLMSQQVGCFFDDINDLAMARHCGLRVQVRRSASPLFMDFTARQGEADYITGHSANEYAIREFSELFLGISGVFPEVVESRIAFDAEYQAYWRARSSIETSYYSWKEGRMYRRNLE